jgi:general secretion pathway protein L
MADPILSIDLTMSPASVVLASVDNRSVSIIEEQRFELIGLAALTIDDAANNDVPLAANGTAEAATQPIGSSGEAEGVSPTTAHGELIHPRSADERHLIDALEAIASKFHERWNKAVAVLPALESLTIEVEVPFRNRKKIAQVLPFEVQDLVPFELDGFSVSYQVVEETPNGGARILVDLYPRNSLQKVLHLFRLVGIDPAVLATPASVLTTVFDLGTDYFQKDCLLAWEAPDYLAIAVFIDGRPRLKRVIPRARATTAPQEPATEWLIQTIRSSFLGLERTHNRTINRVYIFSHSGIAATTLQEQLARETETIQVSELVGGTTDNGNLAPLAAHLVRSVRHHAAINLRSGDLAYRPDIQGFLRAFRGLLPYFVTLIAIIFIWMVGSYAIRSHRISALESAIHSAIHAVLPTASITAGQEGSIVAEENRKLEAHLKELGSLSRLSPLDVLLQISEDVPNLTALTVTNITIRDNNLTLKAKASNTTIDEVERALKAKSKRYCRLEITESRSFGAEKEFELRVELCL